MNLKGLAYDSMVQNICVFLMTIRQQFAFGFCLGGGFLKTVLGKISLWHLESYDSSL